MFNESGAGATFQQPAASAMPRGLQQTRASSTQQTSRGGDVVMA